MTITELYGNPDTFAEYLLVSNAGFEAGVIEKKVSEAFDAICGKYLGIEQYNASKVLTAEIHTKLIEQLKVAVASNALLLAFPYLKVQLDAGGVQYGTDRDKQATVTDKEDLYLALFRDTNNAIDTMLNMLNADHTAFAIWKAGPQFVDFSKYFIRTPQEFELIEGSFSVFRNCRAFMQLVETVVLNKVLGLTLATSIKVLLRAKTLSGKKLELWENYIVPYLARESLYRAATSMAVVKDKYGTVCIYDDTAAGKTRGYKTAEPQRVAAWKADLSKQANELLDAMKDYIATNATDLGIEIAEINLMFINPEEFSTTFH